MPITVGVHNDGPAWIFDRSGGEATGAVDVVFPQGTTVVKIPQQCDFVPKTQWTVLPAHYACGTPYVMAPGQSARFTFQVRVDKAVTHDLGRVWLGTLMSDAKGGVATFPWDPSQAGHTASIVLN